MTGCSQVVSAIDSADRAKELAGALIEARLAACVQVLGPVESVYRWEGAVRQAREWLVIAKTTDAARPALIGKIRALHPYDLPEIIAHPIADGDPDYLSWIRRESTPEAR